MSKTVKTPVIFDGIYRIRSGPPENPRPLYLELRGNYATVAVPLNTSDAQRWRIVSGSDGTYKIISVAGGNVLGVDPPNTPVGSGTDSNQTWTIEPRGNSFVIGDTNNERVLNLDEGGKVQVLPRNNLAGQRWTLDLIQWSQGLNGAGVFKNSRLPCNMISRKPGISTDTFVISDASAINQLPYTVRLMRDGPGEQTNPNAAIILRLVASLRDSIYNMPPVFRHPGDQGTWALINPPFATVNAGWTFAYTLQGLINLASVIPGDPSIDFSVVPTLDPLIVVTPAGERVDVSAWHAGARCIAIYCLAILRAI